MPKNGEHHICPWWMGYILINPFRKLLENPKKILSPYIKPGMKVLEIGPGMGFFSLEIAKMIGTEGRLFCLDVQKKMIQKLRKRALRAGLSERIESRICNEKTLRIGDLKEQIEGRRIII